MEKRKETTQKMEVVTKKLIRHSFLESVEKWPPECIGFFYQPHRPESPCRRIKSKTSQSFLVRRIPEV